MQDILISIQPKWVEKICNEIGKRADGTSVYEKEIEVRKTRPKLEVPFKGLIYCTQARKPIKDDDGRVVLYEDDLALINRWGLGKRVENPCGSLHPGEEMLNGKVIGEFICDKIEDFSKWEYDYPALLRHIDLFAGTKNDFQFIDNYLKGQKKGYGWHISNLKIYDNPKELSEFYARCNVSENKCKLCDNCFDREDYYGRHYAVKQLTRPPQSWGYVEKL